MMLQNTANLRNDRLRGKLYIHNVKEKKEMTITQLEENYGRCCQRAIYYSSYIST